MTVNRATQIGIDRLVRNSWLERTASLVLGGNGPVEIKAALQEDLRKAFQSEKMVKRGSLDKTITILMKIWLTTPVELDDLRARGLELLKCLPKQDRLAVHWGMVMTVYPFWGSVASQVGRLIKLQGTAAAAQVQRRMREQYGERETVARRARYVLRSFVEWGVIRETHGAGIYEPVTAIGIASKELAAWLIEAVVRSGSKTPMTIRSLAESTSLFPFQLPQITVDELVGGSSRLDFVTHNIDEELVVVKEPREAGTGSSGRR